MRRRQTYKNEHNPFDLLRVFIPKGTRALIEQKSKETGLPMSRLLAIALDNELDAPVAFNYPCLVPSTVFVEFAYAEEAQKIARYLIKFPHGTGRDTLMLCRRDIGVENREAFMHGYRELLNAGVIEEVPPPARVKFDYPEGYRYTRLVNAVKPKPKVDSE